MEGLKLIVGADVTQAEKALGDFVKSAQTAGTEAIKAGKKIEGGLTKPLSVAIPQSVDKTVAAFKKLPQASNQATASLLNLGRVAQDAPFGIIGIANNINPLVESFQRLRASSASTGGALRALGASLIGGGGLGLAVSVVTGLMSFFALRSRGASTEVKELSATSKAAEEAQQKFRQALDSAAGSIVNQATKVTDLGKAILDTAGKTNQLTDATVRLGLTQFLFNSKNELIQKRLSSAIEQSLKIEQGSIRTAAKEFTARKKVLDVTEDQARAQQMAAAAAANLGKSVGYDAKDAQATINALDLVDRTARNLGLTFDGLLKAPKDAGKSELEKQMERTIAQARKLASFLDKTTIRSFSFDVDPEDSLKRSFEKARAFIDRTRGDRSIEFDLKIGSLTEFTERLNIITPEVQKKIKEQALDLKDKLQKEIDRLPIAIGVRAQLQFDKEGIERLQKLSQGIGITQPDVSGSALTEAERQAVKLANTVNGVLKPAFGDLFNSILAGKNPLQAFFQSIGDSIKQLLNQLIQAAIQALILSAIFPGGVGAVKGFGGFFKNITGFAAGGIVSGPTLSLIGEGIGTSRSNPEVVAPLDQLRSLIGSITPVQQPQFIMSRIRGRDIVLSQGRTNRSQRRLGA